MTSTTTYVPAVLIAEEKHGDRNLDASTPEAWAASSLALLTERFDDDYWYGDPDEDELDEDLASYLGITEEDIAALPDEVRRLIALRQSQAREELAGFQAHRAWYEAAKKAVDEQDTSFTSTQPGRLGQPVAYLLLTARNQHEYETVKLRHLETRG